MLTLKLDNRIRVIGDVAPSVLHELEAAFTYVNPEYAKAKARSKWKKAPAGMPQYLATFTKSRSGLSFPLGALERLIQILPDAQVERSSAAAGLGPEYGDMALRRMLSQKPFVHLLQPRGFQTKQVETALKQRCTLMRAPPGSGKTTSAFNFIARAGHPALVVLPSETIFKQWIRRAQTELGLREEDVGIIQGSTRRIRPLTIAMAQTLKNCVDDYASTFGVFVADECFPAGTLVLMADGTERPIEAVAEGDMVHAGGCVLALMQREARRTVVVSHEAGDLTCTEEHPVYVRGKGYVDAKDLVAGDLLCVWCGVSTGRPWCDGEAVAEDDVFTAVQEAAPTSVGAADESGLQGSDPHSYADAEPDGGPSGPRRGQCKAEGAPHQCAGWQRPRSDALRKLDVGQAGGGGRAAERHREDEGAVGERVPDALQAGSRASGRQGGGGSGWALAQFTGSPGTGPEEGWVARWARVVGLAFQEHASADGLGGVRSGVPVYNLETERSCYVAGRALVHNCHRHGADTFFSVTDHMRSHYRIGVSADERRADGKEFLIYDLFGPVRHEVTRQAMIDAGFIVDARVVVVPTGVRLPWYTDLRPQHRALGLTQTKLIGALTTSEQRNQVIERVMAECLASGDPTLALSQRIEHCHDLRARAVRMGNGARIGMMLGGKENNREFELTREAMEDGTLKMAMGIYQAVGTGFDLPALSRAIMATPCANNEKGRMQFGQYCGRFERPSRDKGEAAIYYMWDEHVFGARPLRHLLKWKKHVAVLVDGVEVPGREFLKAWKEDAVGDEDPTLGGLFE